MRVKVTRQQAEELSKIFRRYNNDWYSLPEPFQEVFDCLGISYSIIDLETLKIHRSSITKEVEIHGEDSTSY